jgi:hypothetical protein
VFNAIQRHSTPVDLPVAPPEDYVAPSDETFSVSGAVSSRFDCNAAPNPAQIPPRRLSYSVDGLPPARCNARAASITTLP